MYTRDDWRVAAVVFLVALGVYTATLAPTVTLEYSGQLVVAADYLGVARPPGYPVWTILAKSFSVLFSPVTLHGHRNPALGVNFMSALFGALACGTLSMLVSGIGRLILRRDNPSSPRFGRVAVAAASVSASLMFAFSSTLWSQSVVAETHTLTNFAILAFMALLFHWMALGPGHRGLEAVIAFLTGFGWSVSPMFPLMIPLVLLAAASVSRPTFLRFLAAAIAFLVSMLAEARLGAGSPAAAAIVSGGILAGLAACLCCRHTRGAAILWALMLLGLLPYLYLPLAAAQNPPMNMGYACTWQGFLHVLCRGQYEPFSPMSSLAEFGRFREMWAWLLHLSARQFPVPLLLVGMVPLAALPGLAPAARRRLWFLLLGLLLFGPVVLIVVNTGRDLQTAWYARTVYIPFFAIWAVLIGCGIAIALGALGGCGPLRLRKAGGSRSVAGRRGT